MQTKTVDILVREAINSMGLTIHYYVPLLHYALRGLESLSQDFDFGTNVKELKRTVTSYNRIDTPSDLVDIIGVYGRYGDKLKSFHYTDNITKLYNLDGATKIPYPEDESTMPDFIDAKSSRILPFTSSNEFPTVIYPSDDFKYEYAVDTENSEIILGNGHLVSDVYIRYLTTNVSTSNANTVHPYAVDILHAYIEYMYYKGNQSSPQSKVALKKAEYYNEERLARGRFNGLSYNEIMQILYNS